MEIGVNQTTRNAHAVIVCVKLSDDDLGHPDERESFLDLEDACLEALDDTPEIGEVDGIEEGDGFFRIVCLGPDADALFEAIASALRGFDIPEGSYALKQYGLGPDAREERVTL